MKISEVFPSKYLTAADLNGKAYTLTIRTVTLEEMVTHENKKVQKPVCWFVGAQKGFVMNVTNAHIIVALYGDDTSLWEGKRITIYPTQVRAFGTMQDCIRVREEIPAQPKPAAQAAQVEEPSGLDDDEDVTDYDQDGDVLFTPTIHANGHAKSPDDATIAQVKRCNQLGIRFYGTEGWNEQAPKTAHETSKGAVKRIEDLKVVEIEVVMRELERKIAHRAAQLQATGK